MPSIVLNEEEAKELRTVLSLIQIRERTGELGVVHGLDRFVSTNVCKKKKEIETLDAVARRCGIPGIKRFAK
jgi:hypothetical protein